MIDLGFAIGFGLGYVLSLLVYYVNAVQIKKLENENYAMIEKVADALGRLEKRSLKNESTKKRSD